MILTLHGTFGSELSLDFTKELGPRVEIECFEFIEAPVEFQLLRDGKAISEWREGDRESYDLQRGGLEVWQARGTGWTLFDKAHRSDVMTFGVLSRGLALDTRGIAGNFTLLVWPREGTYPQDTCH